MSIPVHSGKGTHRISGISLKMVNIVHRIKISTNRRKYAKFSNLLCGHVYLNCEVMCLFSSGVPCFCFEVELEVFLLLLIILGRCTLYTPVCFAG